MIFFRKRILNGAYELLERLPIQQGVDVNSEAHSVIPEFGAGEIVEIDELSNFQANFRGHLKNGLGWIT